MLATLISMALAAVPMPLAACRVTAAPDCVAVISALISPLSEIAPPLITLIALPVLFVVVKPVIAALPAALIVIVPAVGLIVKPLFTLNVPFDVNAISLPLAILPATVILLPAPVVVIVVVVAGVFVSELICRARLLINETAPLVEFVNAKFAIARSSALAAPMPFTA